MKKLLLSDTEFFGTESSRRLIYRNVYYLGFQLSHKTPDRIPRSLAQLTIDVIFQPSPACGTGNPYCTEMDLFCNLQDPGQRAYVR